MVHGHPGEPQDGRGPRPAAPQRDRERRCLRRLFHQRLRRDRGERHRRHARLGHLHGPPVGPGQRADRVRLLRRPRPQLQALRGRPALGAPPPARARQEDGPRLLRRPRARVLLLHELGRARAHGRGRLLRRPARRPRQRPAQADDAHARQARHPHGGEPPRGRPVAARDRPALRQGAPDGRPRHDHPPDRQGGRGPQRRPRDLHAQAPARPERQRHARASEPLPRRPERDVQRDRPGPPERHRQGLHRRAAQAHARVHARSSTST